MAVTLNANTSTGFIATSDTSGVLQLQTAGTTAVTVDASQNVGIGVTPTSYAGGSNRTLQIYNSASANAELRISNSTTGTGASVGALIQQAGNDMYVWNASNSFMSFGTNATERMRIDSSGNVGIGTNSPFAKLAVEQAGGNQIVARYNIANSPAGIYTAGSAGTSFFGYNLTHLSSNTFNYATTGLMYYIGDNAGIGALSFGVASGTAGNSAGTGGTTNERMRIDTSGRVMIGTTGSGGWSSNQKLAVQGSDTWISAAYQTGASGGAFLGRVDNTAAELAAWYYGGSTKVGSITTNGTTTTYGTLSDHRLKENIAPMTGALEKVALLKPCTYKWKVNGSDGQGFIAHELQAVVPDCVVGEKDAVETYTDEDGNEQTRPKYQGIDTSFLVATLTAAIQEQQAIIQTLTDRITALEGTTP